MFLRIRPDEDPKSPGWRLRLEGSSNGLVHLSSERVLPEKAGDPNARFVEAADYIPMTPEDAEWLHAALGEWLEAKR